MTPKARALCPPYNKAETRRSLPLTNPTSSRAMDETFTFLSLASELQNAILVCHLPLYMHIVCMSVCKYWRAEILPASPVYPQGEEPDKARERLVGFLLEAARAGAVKVLQWYSGMIKSVWRDMDLWDSLPMAMQRYPDLRGSLAKCNIVTGNVLDLIAFGAASGGHVDVCAWVYSTMKKSQPGVGKDKWVHHCYAAIERGHRECVEWIVAKPLGGRTEVLQTAWAWSAAMSGGLVGINLWTSVTSMEAPENPRRKDIDVWYKECAERGDEGMMRWMYARWGTAPDCRIWSLKLFEQIASKNDLGMLMWTRKVWVPYSEDTLLYAFQARHLESVMWMVEDGCPLHAICDTAVEFGDRRLLVALLERGYPGGPPWCCLAVRSHNLEMLTWLREIGCNWDIRTSNAAACQSDFELLRYVVEEGCPMNGATCASAASVGNLGYIMWLVERGCGWDVRVMEQAAKTDNMAILKWARAQGYPWEPSLCAIAARAGNLDLLQWLREEGCPWDRRTRLNAETWTRESGDVEVYQYVTSNGCPTNRWTAHRIKRD